MSEKPLDFPDEDVVAIFEGRKTVTRLPIVSLRGFGRITEFGRSCTPGYDWHFRDRHKRWHDIRLPTLVVRRHWQPRDVAWIREAWGVGCRPCPHNGWVDGLEYRADALLCDDVESLPLRVIEDQDLDEWPSGGWISSRRMPRWASRAALMIVSIRPERVGDVTEAEARAEGCESDADIAARLPHGAKLPIRLRTCRDEFRARWDRRHGKGSPFADNGWVWRLEHHLIAETGN